MDSRRMWKGVGRTVAVGLCMAVMLLPRLAEGRAWINAVLETKGADSRVRRFTVEREVRRAWREGSWRFVLPTV